MFFNVVLANDMGKIGDLEINGISIGNNLLNHFTKQELIQKKKLLSVNSSEKKLFYTSQVGEWLLHYESNERVGMEEEPYYRAIGFSITKKCEGNKKYYKKDNIINILVDCIKNNETKKYINKLISYPSRTYEADEIEVKRDGTLSYDIKYTFDGCYNDNVSINFSSKERFSEYEIPQIKFMIISKELDRILFSKNC
jgi:hypothetical protein